MAPYLLGVDVGTQSSKGALVTLDGHVVAHHAVEHGVSRPFPGWAEHDADGVWWRDVTTIVQALLRQAAANAADVAAVGVSALAPAMVPVDAHGRPLRPGILYGIDTRAHVEIERLNHELGWDTPTHHPPVVCRPSPYPPRSSGSASTSPSSGGTPPRFWEPRATSSTG